MLLKTYLQHMLTPDERYYLLPSGEMFADPEVMALISSYREWFVVLREAGFLEELDYR